MWFKNLRVYTFSQSFTAPADIDSKMQDYIFSNCLKHQAASFGFVSPFGDAHDVLHHRVVDNILLCARKEEKVLPASAVQAQLDDHAARYSEEHGRPLPKKERQTLKEDIIHQMLPQAFSRFSHQWAYIDLNGQRLIVDASASSKAEDFTALLRGALGSLPVKPWGANQPGDIYFTQWLHNGQAPAPFELGADAELRGSGDEAAVVRLKQQDLTSAEIQSHLEHNKTATKLGLQWEDHMAFVLEDDYALKRLQFSDVVKEKNDDLAGSSKSDQIDADFALMALECNQLLDALENAFT